jgi:hypothetical protein
LQLGFVEQHFEEALALELRRFPQVEAFQKQKVEGVEDHPPLLPARKVGLEFGEIGASFMDDYHLPIEDRAFIPVEQPSKFELVINLKAAKAMGIEVPAGIALRADKLIE